MNITRRGVHDEIVWLVEGTAFLAVLSTFNLLSLYQHQTTPAAPYRQPGTLRVAVFLCGAVLGDDESRGGDKTLGGVGWFWQTQTAGGRDLGLAQLRLAEVGSAPKSPTHRRRFDLSPTTPSLQNYRSTSEFELKLHCLYR